VDVLSRPDGEEKAPWTTDVLLPDRFFSRYLSGAASKEDNEREKKGRSFRRVMTHQQLAIPGLSGL
jgi:hypothetical protein